MKCYICMRLKQENRISTARDADVIVEGVSSCMSHSHDILLAKSALVALERTRTQLVAWWARAEELYGDYNRRKGQFKDGTKPSEFYWERWPV